MNVRKTPNGRWQARVKSGGVYVASRTFDRKADASEWHTAQVRALDMGQFINLATGRESVADAWDRWQGTRKNSKSGTTHKADRAAFNHLPPAIRNRPVSAVSAASFETLYDDLLGRLSRASVVRYRNSYRAFFSWAIRQGMCHRNPASAVDVDRGAAGKPEAEMRPFTPEEMWSIYRALVEEAGEGRADFALLLGLTGLRPGELVAIRVRDVQRLPFPAFRVSRSKTDDEPLRHTTKGGKPRTVPLVADAWALVEPRLRDRDPEALLFPSSRGGFMTLDGWRSAVRWEHHAMGRRVYDLRHTFATSSLMDGVNLLTLQHWMGHASISTTEKYLHLVGTDADASAVARLNAAAEARRSAAGGAGGARLES